MTCCLNGGGWWVAKKVMKEFEEDGWMSKGQIMCMRNIERCRGCRAGLLYRYFGVARAFFKNKYGE